MFRFEPNRMYQMPVHFGPVCGPRQDQYGKRYCEYGPQESTHHTLVYETDPKAVEAFLPEGFSLRAPYIIATHKMHRNLPWLAGKGYNVVTFNVPVTFEGIEGTVKGQYQLAIWENHADPILSGREQIGYTKVFAEIEDVQKLRGVGKAALSSWDFRFLEFTFDENKTPADTTELITVLTDPESEGLMHYKYFPKTGDGFCEAEVAYVAFTPKAFPAPEGLPAVPPVEQSFCVGDLTWHIPSWEDMPTQFHIVGGLASLPILRVLGGVKKHMFYYNDVYHQRVIR